MRRLPQGKFFKQSFRQLLDSISGLGSLTILSQRSSSRSDRILSNLRIVVDMKSLGTKGSLEMLLENKNAIIYGAGGAVGGAIARVFAREGAKVFLTGRHLETVDIV